MEGYRKAVAGDIAPLDLLTGHSDELTITGVPATSVQTVSAPRAMLGDIKIAHSVFALPFALLGGAMAAWPPASATATSLHGGEVLGVLLLVVAAMAAARTAAMLANRIFDRELDARNPRTALRPLAAGSVSLRAYVIGLIISSACFVVLSLIFWWSMGNPWPSILAVPVLVWICAYGLFKRFTALCHLWLGASLALSVPAAAIAVNPAAIPGQPAMWLLAVMVWCWVAGFDVIYALQDVDVDEAQGLYSMPSRLGASRAIWVSRVLHIAAVASLVAAWLIDKRLEGWFFAATIVVAALLIVEHATVRRWGTTRMAITFFTLNGVVSCVLGAAGIIDLFANAN